MFAARGLDRQSQHRDSSGIVGHARWDTNGPYSLHAPTCTFLGRMYHTSARRRGTVRVTVARYQCVPGARTRGFRFVMRPNPFSAWRVQRKRVRLPWVSGLPYARTCVKARPRMRSRVWRSSSAKCDRTLIGKPRNVDGSQGGCGQLQSAGHEGAHLWPLWALSMNVKLGPAERICPCQSASTSSASAVKAMVT